MHASAAAIDGALELTEENVEMVLDEVGSVFQRLLVVWTWHILLLLLSLLHAELQQNGVVALQTT